MTRARVLAVACLAAAECVLAACSAIEVAAAPDEQAAAGRMPVYMAGAPAPAVQKVVGELVGYSCHPQRDWPRNTAAQDEEALAQLRLKAARAGAQAVVNVKLEPVHTDRRNACFQGREARGDAALVGVAG